MSVASKRRNRILVLGGGVLLLAAGGAAVILYRRHSMDELAREALERGRTALLAGDHEAALAGIGDYIRRFRERGEVTAQDYLLYAKARRRAPMPNGEHLFVAMGNLRKALELDPASRAIQDELLDCYVTIGFATEALELLRRMLLDSPTDGKLLRLKCDLLDVSRKYNDALEVARKIHELDPQDLAGPVRTLRLMIRAGTSPADIDLWLAAVTAAHPNDARYDLLRAAAYTRRQEHEKAKEILDRVVAASGETKDPKFKALLVSELDAAMRFPDALRVIEGIEDTDDLDLRRECVRRLWYAERPEDAVRRAEQWTGQLAGADPELLALRAVGLVRTSRESEAAPIIQEIAGRTDTAGRAWAVYLQQTLHGGTPDPASAARAMQAAVDTDLDSAILLVVLGEVRAAIGESDSAIHSWTMASVFAPSWARPLCRIAETLRRTGRPVLAVPAARAALARAPNQIEAVSTWIRTHADLAARLDERQVASLLVAAATIQSDIPQTSSEMLPIEVGLLARSDKARAAERLRAVLASQKGTSEDTLLRLAQIAEQAGLELDSQLLDLSEALYGVTPRLALARAIARARVSGSEAGLRALDELRGRAGRGAPVTAAPGSAARGASVDWDLIRAAYLEAVGHPKSAETWIALADANPVVLPVQLGALASGSVWKDRAAVDRIIERVRESTGESGITWRTARARWLLTDPTASATAIAEAAKVLEEALAAAPTSTPARLLLAEAKERLGDLDGADAQLRAAAALRPDNPWISIELARIALRRGQGDAAKQHLDRALAAPDLTPEQAERAAYLLASQGDIGRTADLLQPLTTQERTNRQGLLLLAAVQAGLGDTERALQACERLLDQPNPIVVEMAADLYAASGRAEESKAVLAKLDGMELAPGDREIIRARIAAKWSPAEEARLAFERAVGAAPARADVWTAFAAFAVSSGDKASLVRILDDPASSASEPVRFLAANREISTAVLSDEEMRLLVRAAMDDEACRVPVMEALRTLAERWPDPSRRADATRRIVALAAQNPRVLTLQILAADICRRTGDLRQGAEIAARTMKEFPNSLSAARQAAELSGGAGRWNEALAAARVWKARTGRRDLRPDLFVAGALLRTDHASEAALILESHVAESLSDPVGNSATLITYAVALARGRGMTKAGPFLADLAARSPRWRTIPIEVTPDWFGDASTAIAWLDTCAAQVPADDAAMRLQLARAWASAWTHYRTPELRTRARTLLNELTTAPDASADALFTAAALAERSGDLPGARRVYEAALARDPRHAASLNNLAMILADAGQWQDAVKRANELVAANPRVPEFLDTLAYALRKGRQFDQSKTRLAEAIDLDPLNPAWRIALAETLSLAEQPADAARMVASVEELASNGTPLSPDLRGRLERLKAQRR